MNQNWKQVLGDRNYTSYGGVFMWKETFDGVGVEHGKAALLFEITNGSEHGLGPCHFVTLRIVNPAMITKKEKQTMCDSCDVDYDRLFTKDGRMQASNDEGLFVEACVAAHSYGHSALVECEEIPYEEGEEDSEGHEEILFDWAERQIKEKLAGGMMMGDFLDQPQNMVMNDGWDFLRGTIGF